MDERRAPGTSSAKATFSSAGRSSSRRKSWNTMPRRRRSIGTSRGRSSATLKPETRTSPLVTGSSGANSLRAGGLAGARMTGEKHELALGDVERHVLEGEPPLGEGLEDIRELDHLLLRQGLREVRDDVVGVLQSDGKSQEAIGDAGPRPRLGREPRV